MKYFSYVKKIKKKEKKKETHGVGEMAQYTKCLSLQQEGQIYIPRAHAQAGGAALVVFKMRRQDLQGQVAS